MLYTLQPDNAVNKENLLYCVNTLSNQSHDEYMHGEIISAFILLAQL